MVPQESSHEGPSVNIKLTSTGGPRSVDMHTRWQGRPLTPISGDAALAY